MKTSNNIPFIVTEYNKPFPVGYYWQCFNVGTIEGLFSTYPTNYSIYSLCNKEVGNGHLEDLLEHFEALCKTNNKDLIFLDVFNRRFKKHLIEKRGFDILGNDHVIKKY